MGKYNCFGCGTSVHMVKYDPIANIQGCESKKAQTTGPNSYSPKKNRLDALKSRVINQSVPFGYQYVAVF